MTSPVFGLCAALLQKMSGANEFASFFADDQRLRIVRAVFEAYYGEVGEGSVVFDTNRAWTSKLPLVAELYPNARIICCVREVGWVIDSVERLVRQNALQPSKIFNYQVGGSIYSRVETLMDSENGLVGHAWSSLREAWFGADARRLILVRYDSLVQQPRQILDRLYRELGEAPFAHDFNHVVYDAPDYDTQLGMPGLHKVRERVEFVKREPTIPPDVFAKYADANFWLNLKLNLRNVTVL